MTHLVANHTQRGAMFGLDARIALAIFGGLSVITGAALYNAIGQTTTTALVAELDNIGKGYINYVLDTGVDTTTIANLKTDTVAGWNGPYIALQDATDHPRYGALALVQQSDAAWTDGTPVACSGTNCWVWLTLTLVDNRLADNMDNSIDGTAEGAEDGDLGSMRYNDTVTGNVTVYYKIATTQ